MCRFIKAFAIVIVPHRNSSFEAVKFYLNTKCRYSDSKYMCMFIVKTIQWKYNKQSCQRQASNYQLVRVCAKTCAAILKRRQFFNM